MFKKTINTIIAFFILIPTFVHADGGIMPKPDYWSYETRQRAAIVYQDKTETLVLSTSFQGNTKDFGYIVPTPNQPQVTKVSNDIFENLETLTLDVDNIRPLAASGTASSNAFEKSEVQVVEEKKVGIYDVKVLSSTDSTALFNWLKENNFTYPENKKYILDEYIQNKWFFTVAKVSSESITTDVENDLHNGTLAPLKLVFGAENIVYPLKISSVTDESPISNYRAISSPQPASTTVSQPEIAPYYPGTSITLYIFADHKKDVTGFNTEYANWIKQAEIEKIAKDDQGNAWVKPNSQRMYLTKLNRSMTNREMSNDLFPDNAANNNKVGAPNWWEADAFYIAIVCIFFFFLISFYISMFWQFTSQSKICKKICWILQIISLIIVLIPLFALLFYSLSNSLNVFNLKAFNYYYATPNLYSSVVLFLLIIQPISMIIIMVAENYVQKKINQIIKANKQK
jgi:hypothetical protein